MIDGERELRLPIELGPISSDEYAPLPPSPVVREAARRALRDSEDRARRTGMTRRSFLRSAAGAALTLFWLDACTREEAQVRGQEPGGGFALTPEATIDQDAARQTIGGEEFVFDVQSHLLAYDLSRPAGDSWFGQSFPQAGCGEGDPRACFTVERYLDEVFLNSDTTMAVLSALPILPGPDNPIRIEVMEQARELTDRLCGPGRLLLHGQANPSLGPLPVALDAMERLARSHRIGAWKVFTHAPGPAWRLDDGDPSLRPVGGAFLEQAERLGVRIVCVHKGVAGGDANASPQDVGPAARAHPTVAFVVYHSGWEPDVTEGPYVDATRDEGVNRLVSTVLDNGRPANVYAEIGTTWFNLMRDPTQAAHFLGKLLRYLGEDRILWGTDSIWYGSPQQQIVAFRAFQISPQLQDRYGYPALTDAAKRKILGGNAARLYGVKPATVRCRFSRAELEEIRRST